MTKPTIWCLFSFSVENNYDRPDNTLLRWWSNRPTIEELGKFLCHPLSASGDADILALVNIWKGTADQFIHRGTYYLLQPVEEGEMP